MLFHALTLIAAFASVANGHFRLLYPEPRGAFVADQEPNFCGGYTDAVSNRSTFPLSGGVYSIRTSHPSFTIGVMVSTVQNPNNFDNFSSSGQVQYVNPLTKVQDPGTLCFPLDFSKSNISGLTNGANVTIQIVNVGSDGNLYQCADLTLSNTFTTPSNVSCSNDTSTATSSAAGSTQTGSGNGGLGRAETLSAWAAGLMGLMGILFGVL